jgi:hypothetical protein
MHAAPPVSYLACPSKRTPQVRSLSSNHTRSAQIRRYHTRFSVSLSVGEASGLARFAADNAEQVRALLVAAAL